MKRSLHAIVALLMLLVAQAVHAFEFWPVCTDESAPESCEKGIRLKFDKRNLKKGVGYLKNHIAPLSVLVPEGFWYRRDGEYNVFGIGIPEERLLPRMAAAQLQLVRWFYEDLDYELPVPKVTWERIVAINEIIVGKHVDFQVPGYHNYDEHMVSQLKMDFVSESNIEEITRDVTQLRKVAGIENYGNWSYAAHGQLSNPLPTDKETVLFDLSSDAIKNILHKRAVFFEKLLKIPGLERLQSLRGDQGNYYIEHDTNLYLLDSARIYYETRQWHTCLHSEDYNSFEFSVTSDDPIFYLFDVPDNKGKTPQDYPNPCDQCVRTWATLLPSTRPQDRSLFGSIFLVTSHNFVERKDMFAAALEDLNRELQAVMTPAELIDVLSVAWRQMTLAHAFPDGNGRTIRLLINSLLMAYSLPPLSCLPDCLPYSHTLAQFREKMRRAIKLTRVQRPLSHYPEWLHTPEDSALLEWINSL